MDILLSLVISIGVPLLVLVVVKSIVYRSLAKKSSVTFTFDTTQLKELGFEMALTSVDHFIEVIKQPGMTIERMTHILESCKECLEEDQAVHQAQTIINQPK